MKQQILSILCTLLSIYPLYSTQEKKLRADIIIFSFDRPLQLYALLESLERYVTDIDSISVIYRTSNERYYNALKQVASQFPNIQFYKQNTIDDFKILTLHTMKNTSSEYIVFAVDDNIVKDTVELHECITWLENTQAYGFYLKLGTHLTYCYTENSSQIVPPYQQVHDHIYAWKFEDGEKDWNYPNTVDMTLYRKKDLLYVFHSLEYSNPNLLEGKWAAWYVQHKIANSIGLFYENSKIVNIPLNKVQTINILNRDMNLFTPQELLEKFEAGYKMDTMPLYQIKNNAVHTEYEPTFILQ